MTVNIENQTMQANLETLRQLIQVVTDLRNGYVRPYEAHQDNPVIIRHLGQASDQLVLAFLAIKEQSSKS